ncbi:CHAT domain-containing protein [Paractinoplanes lichenicola]|uniref:CHAT domain-containing protein n=1 Tax=Paractinoplanes lichenicola TaxID=2802976 RepID=A0ABS1W5S6_9ACTN|nr:CHAT domain-containing protein [Actinoplanes lichenicola]MBL7262091.1 CHAT domain-containing protein [Actinoplanes lichenicola]
MGDVIFGNKQVGDVLNGGNKYVVNPGPASSPPAERRVILMMSANPVTTQPLRLDEEHRAIDRAVADAQASHLLEVRAATAVRLEDLQYALLRHRPAVVHFSGHGDPVRGIQVTDDRGLARSVPPDALSRLFEILARGIDCVVLNACFTEAQASAIARHVPCVIGMRGGVLDKSAIRFAAGFYQGIAYGSSIGTSFELARNGLDLHGVPHSDVPQLITQPGADTRTVIDR